MLPGKVSPELAVFQAEALLELDLSQQALELLEKVSPLIPGDSQVHAWCLQAQVLLRTGWYDSAILLANQAAKSTYSVELRAEALASVITGYAAKRCWRLSDFSLHEAITLAPAHPKILAAQARLYLESDRRLEARSIYENLEKLPSQWAKAFSVWGKSYIAYLMGEFDRADLLAGTTLIDSSEVVSPLYILAQVALARNKVGRLEEVLKEIKRRSPQAEGLTWYEVELDRLKKRLAPAAIGSRRRLAAFPTTVQRRNYCGPSTVELVLRYWQGSSGLTNDQIAEKIKYSISGTPLYRMREFFHLAGFDTIRCQAPVSVLQKAIDAGFPVVIQEEYPGSSHVAVVIGYDMGDGTIELQDPMTHIVTTAPVDKLNQLRRTYMDSALIAFPRGQGYEKTLARLEIFDEQAFVWTDQAVLEIEAGRFQAAIGLLEKAIRRKPDLSLSWMLLLHTHLEEWQRLLVEKFPPGDDNPELGMMRDKFYAALRRARRRLPEAEFIHQFAGWGALADHDYERALESFRRACFIDSEDARNHASLAECYFELRDYPGALNAAWDGLHCDASVPAVNIWLARSLAAQSNENDFHYAQAAVDLDDENWLAHLALAEASLVHENIVLARQELNQALFLAPSNSEVRLMECIVEIAEGNSQLAERQIQEILASPQHLSSSTLFRAYQSLGKIYFNAGQFGRAITLAHQLLDLFPEDRWAQKFLASARCEELIMADKTLAPDELSEVIALYEGAILVNQGDAWIIRDFITYLEALTDGQTVIDELQGLRKNYPDDQSLYFLFGRLYRHIGDEKSAAEAMLIALESESGLQTWEEISEAMQTVISAMGVMRGTERILALADTNGGLSIEKKRILGMVLSTLPELGENLARDLLKQVLKENPIDGEVILALGHIAESDVERENLYRRALMILPSWWFARQNLAVFLIEHGRAAEALEFTRGHEQDSPEMMVAHGRALLGAGHYEEAVDVFNRVIRNSEQPDTWLYTWMWQAELRSGRRERALRTARQGHALFPQELGWFLHIAESLRSLDRFDEADRTIRKGLAHGLDGVEALRAEYETAIALQEPETALGLLDQLITHQDRAADGYLSWAEAQRFRLLIEAGRVEETLALLQSANLTENGWGEAAWIAVSASDHELALELSQRALSLNANNYFGLLAIAQILNDTGKEQEAIEAWLALRDAYPNQHDAYEKLAILLALEGQLEQGILLAEQAVRLGPFCPEAWATRGLVGFLAGHLEDARQDLMTAWNRMNPQQRDKSFEYWYLLAYLSQEDEEMQRCREIASNQIKLPLQQKIFQALRERIED